MGRDRGAEDKKPQHKSHAAGLSITKLANEVFVEFLNRVGESAGIAVKIISL